MTFDQIDRMVRGANPVPDPSALEAVAAPVLVFNRSRSVDMQTQERVEGRTEKPRPRWGPLVAVGGVVVALGVFSALFILNTNGSTEPPSESATTVAPVVAPPTDEVPPLGLEIVNMDGMTTNLGLPRDAWMADLSPDGRRVVFITASTDVAFCAGCQPGDTARMAIVPVGTTFGGFVDFSRGGLSSLGQPAWSPDGTRIAFQASYQGNVDIYVAEIPKVAHKTGARYSDVPTTRLTTDPGVDQFPAWSPDGTVIFYDNLGEGPVDSGISETGEIWSVPVTGGQTTRLTDNDIADMQPDVRPDGLVAYWSEGEIWVMEQDGSRAHRLSNVQLDLGWNPRWSPDGTKLALLHYDFRQPKATFGPNPIHERLLPPLNVVIVDVESGEYTPLEVQVASFYNPVSWMPDGTALVVTRYR